MTSASFSSQSNQPLPSLIGGEFPRVTRLVTVASGVGALPAGAVLGRTGGTRRFVLSVAMATDGTEKPCAILAEPVDAAAGDVEAIAYFSGEFNPDQLTFGVGHSVATAADPLRDVSIFI